MKKYYIELCTWELSTEIIVELDDHQLEAVKKISTESFKESNEDMDSPVLRIIRQYGEDKNCPDCGQMMKQLPDFYWCPKCSTTITPPIQNI